MVVSSSYRRVTAPVARSTSCNTERMRGDDLRVFNSTARLTYGAAGSPTTLDGATTFALAGLTKTS